MSGINFEELYAQRAEATGVAGDRIPFEFAGTQWSFRDPQTLTDQEKEHLADLEFDPDVAEFYMGADQYTDFLATTASITLNDGKTVDVPGSSSVFNDVFIRHMQQVQDTIAERPTRPNRSSRRARKR